MPNHQKIQALSNLIGDVYECDVHMMNEGFVIENKPPTMVYRGDPITYFRIEFSIIKQYDTNKERDELKWIIYCSKSGTLETHTQIINHSKIMKFSKDALYGYFKRYSEMGVMPLGEKYQ